MDSGKKPKILTKVEKIQEELLSQCESTLDLIRKEDQSRIDMKYASKHMQAITIAMINSIQRANMETMKEKETLQMFALKDKLFSISKIFHDYIKAQLKEFQEVISQQKIMEEKKYKDGRQYNGEMKDGKRHGYGEMINADQSIYKGHWVANKRNGQGLAKYLNGTQYEGEWLDGNYEGFGVFIDSNGDRYSGQWKEDKKHGQGIYEFKNGDIFEGTWEDDQKHGQGILTMAGKQHTSSWEKGKKQKEALIGKKPPSLKKEADKKSFDEINAGLIAKYTNKEYWPKPYSVSIQGHKIEGTYYGKLINGQPAGKGFFVSTDNADFDEFTLEGYWENGSLKDSAEAVYHAVNLIKIVGPFVDGQPNGKCSEFFDQKIEFKGIFEKGKKNGSGFLYNTKEEVKSKVYFLNDICQNEILKCTSDCIPFYKRFIKAGKKTSIESNCDCDRKGIVEFKFKCKCPDDHDHNFNAVCDFDATLRFNDKFNW